MSGTIGLTEVQATKMAELKTRKTVSTIDPQKVKPLTALMDKELDSLEYKSEHPELPSGAIEYLKEWYIAKKYHRKKDFFNKFVEKGLMVESIAIEMVSKKFGEELFKNEQFFDDGFIWGVPDTFLDRIVWDTKASWDVFSFPFLEQYNPEPKYEWQMHGYMAIVPGIEEARLNYCLIDTPGPLIDLELKKLYFKSGGRVEDWNPEVSNELRQNYLFSDIPDEEKIREYIFKKDQSKIDAIHQRVKMCREFIDLYF